MSEDADTEVAISEEAGERLSRDNQLQAAFDILTSLALYASNNTGQGLPVPK